MRTYAYVICLLVTSFLLAACGSQPVVPHAPDPVVPTKQTVDVDPELLADCPKLKMLDVQNYPKEQALKIISDWMNQYSLCARNHHALADLTAQAFNINKVPNK